MNNPDDATNANIKKSAALTVCLEKTTLIEEKISSAENIKNKSKITLNPFFSDT
jgi:hypothetical protein